MAPMGKSKKGGESEKTVVIEAENTEAHEVEEENEEEDKDYDLLGELDLPEPVLKRVKGLRKMHEQYEQLEAEYKEQRLALEKQFLAKKEVLYKQRQGVIKGESDISEEGVISETAPAVTDNKDEQGIPSFWLTSLSSNPVVGDLITQDDVPALETLMNITCAYDEKFTEFTLSFHFAENEFFSNDVLTKKYLVHPDLLDDKNPALSLVEGTEIQWKQGKNLCVTEITKKQKAKSGRNKGQVRTVTRTVPKASFFHYFDERSEEDNEDEEDENEQNHDEDQEGRIKLNLDEDYDIGHTIRTSIIPEAILWFTGEAEYYGGEDMEGAFGEDDEDEEGEEDEEEEGEEGEEEEGEAAAAAPKDKKKNKGGNAGANAAAASGDKPPECKQN